MATRGPKPRPPTEKQIRGNPGKRPIRTVVPAPRSGDLICPEAVVNDERARTYWDFFLREAGPGLLAPIDAPLLAKLCTCLSRADKIEAQFDDQFVILGAQGHMVRNPLLVALRAEVDQARQLAAMLAIPPAERNRVGAREKEPDDPAEKYFN